MIGISIRLAAVACVLLTFGHANAETVKCSAFRTVTCDPRNGKCQEDEMDGRTGAIFTIDRENKAIGQSGSTSMSNSFSIAHVFEMPYGPGPPDVEHSVVGTKVGPASVETIMLGEHYFLWSLVASVYATASVTTGTCTGLTPLPSTTPPRVP